MLDELVEMSAVLASMAEPFDAMAETLDAMAVALSSAEDSSVLRSVVTP
jgi:hypothetical protein